MVRDTRHFMEIEDVDVSGRKISFKAGFTGMDTKPEDVKTRIDEYFTMNEAFQVKNVNCEITESSLK
jgi:hypothetical protein